MDRDHINVNRGRSFGDTFRDSEAVFLAWRQATNYRKWVIDTIRPYLVGDILEVGAGIGSFTEMLAACPAARVTAIEPCRELHSLSRKYVRDPRVTWIGSTLPEFAAETSAKFDCILYINVLEHIGADDDELRQARTLLRPGGKLCIFVPALPWLFSEFDRNCGHFRRYTRAGLEKSLDDAGFVKVQLRYFDLAGIAPWYVFAVLGKWEMRPRAMQFYDRYIVPICSRLERRFPVPVGKNLVAVYNLPDSDAIGFSE